MVASTPAGVPSTARGRLGFAGVRTRTAPACIPRSPVRLRLELAVAAVAPVGPWLSKLRVTSMREGLLAGLVEGTRR